AVALLVEERAQLLDRLLRRALRVLELDPAVLERVHEHAELRRIARVVLAVLVPDRVVVARGRRVRLVVGGLEVLVLVRVALDRRVLELAARGGRRLLEVGLLDRRDRRGLARGGRPGAPAAVAPAEGARGDRDHA